MREPLVTGVSTTAKSWRAVDSRKQTTDSRQRVTRVAHGSTQTSNPPSPEVATHDVRSSIRSSNRRSSSSSISSSSNSIKSNSNSNSTVPSIADWATPARTLHQPVGGEGGSDEDDEEFVEEPVVHVNNQGQGDSDAKLPVPSPVAMQSAPPTHKDLALALPTPEQLAEFYEHHYHRSPTPLTGGGGGGSSSSSSRDVALSASSNLSTFWKQRYLARVLRRPSLYSSPNQASNASNGTTNHTLPFSSVSQPALGSAQLASGAVLGHRTPSPVQPQPTARGTSPVLRPPTLSPGEAPSFTTTYLQSTLFHNFHPHYNSYTGSAHRSHPRASRPDASSSNAPNSLYDSLYAGSGGYAQTPSLAGATLTSFGGLPTSPVSPAFRRTAPMS
jgi:hypothetical protein